MSDSKKFRELQRQAAQIIRVLELGMKEIDSAYVQFVREIAASYKELPGEELVVAEWL
jgi:hypothetical protein